MPVRSSSSSVLKWPDARTVSEALRAWAAAGANVHPELLRVGYFGSYARGDWGVGSDLDVVVVVDHAGKPRPDRALDWPAESLPVPVDLTVYTAEEWHALEASRSRLGQTLAAETRWVWSRDRT